MKIQKFKNYSHTCPCKIFEKFLILILRKNYISFLSYDPSDIF